MSRQGQLPPRCPIQKKSISNLANGPLYTSSPVESYIGYYKSPSQSFSLEDQPAWLDDLLSEADANSGGVGLRRSTSDSVVLMRDIMDSLSSLNPIDDEEISSIAEPCGGLESSCVYGPNSPRSRNSSPFSNNTIASAFSEYVSQKPNQYLDDNVTGVPHSDLREDACGSAGMSNVETKTAKRHPGQRSRVRKLQYIAELERTVTMLQTVEADLSVRVASLLQKRVALSLENSQLKQQMARLKQDKLLMEGEYQSLKKEAQRLKSNLANMSNSKVRTHFGSNITTKATGSNLDWKMLDMRKLNLD